MIQSTLNQLCRIRTGKVDVNSGNPDGKYPFFTCARDFTFSDEFDFDCEAILIAGNGEVGLSHYYNGKFQAYQRTYVLDDFRDVFVPYLKYVIDAKLIPHLKGLTHGSSIPYIRKGGLESCPVPLPSLEGQKRIAGILDEADRVRKKSQALIDKYDELAQSLFFDMFGDPVTNPKGWEVVQLGEKLVTKGGKRLPKGADYSVSPTEWPYLRVADMRVNAVELGELKFLTEEVQSKISRYTISKDDVFISIAGTIGVAGWIPDELDGCNLTENAAKIVGLREARLRKEFLSFFLNSHFVQREIEARTMAVGVPKLALFRIESLPLMLPPMELQEEFLVRLRKIQACKSHLGQNVQGGNNLFNALLQKAFKGELN